MLFLIVGARMFCHVLQTADSPALAASHALSSRPSRRISRRHLQIAALESIAPICATNATDAARQKGPVERCLEIRTEATVSGALDVGGADVPMGAISNGMEGCPLGEAHVSSPPLRPSPGNTPACHG